MATCCNTKWSLLLAWVLLDDRGADLEVSDQLLEVGGVCTLEVPEELPPPVHKLYEASQTAEVLQVSEHLVCCVGAVL